MLTPVPTKRKHRRPVVKPIEPEPAPAALVLVAASFDPDGPEVYLTFDRAIDISALVVAQFALADGPDGGQFVGFNAPSLVGPNEVQVLMNRTGDYSGADQLLTVGSTNGIIAVDDGGMWGGVTDLVLPVP